MLNENAQEAAEALQSRLCGIKGAQIVTRIFGNYSQPAETHQEFLVLMLRYAWQSIVARKIRNSR